MRRLAERLRAAGLRVWFDEWEVPAAAPRQSAAFSIRTPGRGEEEDGGALPRRRYDLAIERGLEASRSLVLWLSPAALESDWVGLERSTVLFRDPANAGRRFIPLLLADCWPSRLAKMAYRISNQAGSDTYAHPHHRFAAREVFQMKELSQCL